MSYVAGIILLHCGPPEDCFRVFCNLLNSEIIQSFYDFDLKKINKVYKVFWKLMKENLPQYYQHLRSDNTSCSTFLFEWILTLFSSSLEIEACTYLWDQIYFYGEIFVLKASIAVCRAIYDQNKSVIDSNTCDGLRLLKDAR
jgi:hypothetical protein